MHFLAALLEVHQCFMEVIAVEVSHRSVETEVLRVEDVLLVDILRGTACAASSFLSQLLVQPSEVLRWDCFLELVTLREVRAWLPWCQMSRYADCVQTKGSEFLICLCALCCRRVLVDLRPWGDGASLLVSLTRVTVLASVETLFSCGRLTLPW